MIYHCKNLRPGNVVLCVTDVALETDCGFGFGVWNHIPSWFDGYDRVDMVLARYWS